MFEQDGFKCGGLDYSSSLINIAQKVLKTKDLTCDEAINCKVEPKYDMILSNSVISYFQDINYAQSVLEKMYGKSKYSIGLIDVHDIEKKKDFIEFRKKTIKDYEQKYENLPKLFYSKDFFVEFAVQHGMKIEFCKSDVKGYWNNDFVFNCYMYKQ